MIKQVLKDNFEDDDLMKSRFCSGDSDHVVKTLMYRWLTGSSALPADTVNA